ncbi:type II toxin-antitoxin system RelE family toxin [Fusobacterium polymorphum]|uniref:type II toxin-antitoxin system RelE family toxin n=1 Tax=Fusobacterium nucleatum subsp. polymorphum TaxID=76857 RepID=UPI000C1B2571|nr:type II toxin-antitoxin system RelE/ParE family toxin [Fusobacterium polymorphum]PIM76080.1 type II toxin-antitoxin system mRNA interferase toxin, RelE/StbE family [Fusobacterium polymorphum]
MYKVYFDKKVEKDFKKLDKKVLKLILDWIENNLENIEEPRSKGKALVGNLKDYCRYRTGDYRLITKIDDGKLLIIALELKHRKEVYE